jgi:hypothetical protein
MHPTGAICAIPNKRLAIKQTIRAVVAQSELDTLSVIQQAVDTKVPEAERSSVPALNVEELRRLHEGVLARYGLRPSEW